MSKKTPLTAVLMSCCLTAVAIEPASAPAMAAAPGLTFPGPLPGHAASSLDDTRLGLSNDILAMSWTLDNGSLRPAELVDRMTSRTVALQGEVFVIVLDDNTRINASEMVLVRTPRSGPLTAAAQSPRVAARSGGRELILDLRTADAKLFVTWRARLRDASNYIRQAVALSSSSNVAVRELILLDLTGIDADARVAGQVDGSPVVAGSFFLGYEHPMAVHAVEPTSAADPAAAKRIRGAFRRTLMVKPSKPVLQTTVIGVAPEGQMHRAFLHYIERERAHPYRPFLHYNSWYDIGYFSRFDESACLDVIKTYGEEFVRKRGGVLDSLLFDDGWDDTSKLWKFHDGLPNGFKKIRDAAAEYGSAPGVWLSPWGGYGDPRKERIAAGTAAGYPTNERGFVLSAPKYYGLFRRICLQMMREYGVNQFKFDGIGNAEGTYPRSAFASDFEAAIHLIRELRRKDPDLYINLTTGTWPSPFWLLYADSTWRGGHDHEFTGTGSERQRWMTYRDAQTYQNIVQRGPLYPLSSLMLHGVIYARHARGLQEDPGGDLRSEIRSAFGSGTQLQELYITPGQLTAQNWDDLAAAAAWWRANQGVLSDTHWIGGDPEQLQVYGWAAWTPARGTLTLRNPADKPQRIDLNAASIFELPGGAPPEYTLSSPFPDQRVASLTLKAGNAQALELQPFEVLVFDARPAGR